MTDETIYYDIVFVAFTGCFSPPMVVIKGVNNPVKVGWDNTLAIEFKYLYRMLANIRDTRENHRYLELAGISLAEFRAAQHFEAGEYT